MKVTFLIGNGFDLRQGLKTAYKNFLNYYLKNNKNEPASVQKLKDNIRQEELLWSDFERLLGEITKFYTLEEKDAFLAALKHMRHSMAAYLHNQSKKFKFKTSKHRKELKRSLENLFFKNGYMHPDKDIIPVTQEMYYQFVVFNYNAILFDMLGKIQRKEAMRNRNRITDQIDIRERLIHCSTEYGFILGVNDASQIKNVEFKEDNDICNALIKRNQRKIMYNTYEISDYIIDSDIVYVFGMSIGDTDERYWEQLIEWLKGNKDTTLVISHYDKNILPIDPVEIEQVKLLLINKLNNWGLPEDRNSKVKILINPKIFNFARRTKNRI